MSTCTIGPSAVTGECCGKPAVRVVRGFSGEVYYECAEHAGPAHYAGRTHDGAHVGDEVPVHRHGKVYFGKVERVTRTGRVFARVRYDNGVERVVEVDR